MAQHQEKIIMERRIKVENGATTADVFRVYTSPWATDVFGQFGMKFDPQMMERMDRLNRAARKFSRRVKQVCLLVLMLRL